MEWLVILDVAVLIVIIVGVLINLSIFRIQDKRIDLVNKRLDLIMRLKDAGC